MRSPSPERDPDEAAALKSFLEKVKLYKSEEESSENVTSTSKNLTNWLHVTGIHIYINELRQDGLRVTQDLLISTATDSQVAAMVPFVANWIDKSMHMLYRSGFFVRRAVMSETRCVVMTCSLPQLS